MKTQICKKCERGITLNNFNRHNESCEGKVETVNTEQWKVREGKYKCPHCQIVLKKKQLSSHMWRSHTVTGKAHNATKDYIKGTRIAWNKGLTNLTDERVLKNTVNAQQALKSLKKQGWRKKNPKFSEEYLKHLSIRQSLHNSGGKCKWFEVDGQKVQGTWELKLALKFKSLNIKWAKPKVNKDVYFYELNGKQRTYTPDFYLEELDLFLEVKGHWWGDDKRKMQLVLTQNINLSFKLKLVMKDMFNEILQAKTKEELISTLGRCGHIALV